MRYYINDNGGWLTVSGDADVFGIVPDGYREVTEEEYYAATGAILLPATVAPPAPAQE